MDSNSTHNNGSDRGGGVVTGVEHRAVGLDCGAIGNSGVRSHHSAFHFAGLQLLQGSPPRIRHHSQSLLHSGPRLLLGFISRTHLICILNFQIKNVFLHVQEKSSKQSVEYLYWRASMDVGLHIPSLQLPVSSKHLIQKL